MSHILHTVNKSPFSHSSLKQCLSRIQSGDSILLLEDGVYGALISHPYAVLMNPSSQYYALQGDLDARGLTGPQLLSHVTPIDYDEFVALSVQHTAVQSWY